MADKSVARQTKLWTKRGGSIRYRWHERCGDWWCATRDARAGTPATPLPPEADSLGPPSIAMTKVSIGAETGRAWGTPRTVALGQLGRARAEREWVLFHADTTDLQVARAQAAARRTTASGFLESATSHLTSLTGPSDDEARVAAPGEEHASPQVRAGRRHAEHAARRQALQAQMRTAQETIAEADVEVAQLDEQIRIRRDVAVVRVAMIEAYVRRRCSAYLSRLVRTHPDGKRVGSLIRTDWSQQPSWLQNGPPAPDGGA